MFTGVEIQCIGHFKLLFCLLRLDHCPKIQDTTIRVLSNVTGCKECVDDIAASGVLPMLLQVLYSQPETGPGLLVTLMVFQSLMGDTRMVKECLAQSKCVLQVTI